MTNLESRLEKIAKSSRSKSTKPREDEQQLVFVNVEDASNTDQTDESASQEEHDRKQN